MTATLQADTGQVIPLDVDRWRAAPDRVERQLLATVTGPVLDVGCGPGRITAYLASAGVAALGIDPSPVALDEARARGAAVLCRSVFDAVPGEGRWATVLLLDGNIGIGGDPTTLLVRVAGLLHPGGDAVVEVEPPGVPTEVLRVRVHGDRARPSAAFAWARVGADGVAALMEAAGLRFIRCTPIGHRWFAVARK